MAPIVAEPSPVEEGGWVCSEDESGLGDGDEELEKEMEAALEVLNCLICGNASDKVNTTCISLVVADN